MNPISPSTKRTRPYSEKFIMAQATGVFYNLAYRRKPKITKFEPNPLEWDGTTLYFHTRMRPIMLATWHEGFLVVRSDDTFDPETVAEFHLGSVRAKDVAHQLQGFLFTRKRPFLIAKGPLEESYLAEAVLTRVLRGL